MAEHRRHIQLWQTLRTANITSARDSGVAEIFYRTESYDCDVPSDCDLRLTRAGVLNTAATLLREPAATSVEINEAAMVSAWPSLLLFAAVLRIRRLLTDESPQIGFYAIENLDPAVSVARLTHLPHGVSRRLASAIVRFICAACDHIVFGTPAARDLYLGYLPRHSEERHRLLPQLSRACECTWKPSEELIVFLGSFEDRKGVLEACEAWQRISGQLAGWRFTVVGQGPLESAVRAVAAPDPTMDVVLAPSREQICELLRAASVVVLPSRRKRAWREQVGLPIVEALAHGCTLVTTDETGLADWLRVGGHQVVAEEELQTLLPEALVVAALTPLPAADIYAGLPEEDTRVSVTRALRDWDAPDPLSVPAGVR